MRHELVSDHVCQSEGDGERAHWVRYGYGVALAFGKLAVTMLSGISICSSAKC